MSSQQHSGYSPQKAGLAVWTYVGEGADLTHKELVEHLQQVALVVTERRWWKGGILPGIDAWVTLHSRL